MGNSTIANTAAVLIRGSIFIPCQFCSRKISARGYTAEINNQILRKAMKHYLYAMGAIFCWASLPVATGSGLEELATEELMFFSFFSAAAFLYFQDVLLKKSFWLYLPGWKPLLLGVWGIFCYHFTYYEAMNHAPLAEGAILATTWSFWIECSFHL